MRMLKMWVGTFQRQQNIGVLVEYKRCVLVMYKGRAVATVNFFLFFIKIQGYM